jgi:hypothetical protein
LVLKFICWLFLSNPTPGCYLSLFHFTPTNFAADRCDWYSEPFLTSDKFRNCTSPGPNVLMLGWCVCVSLVSIALCLRSVTPGLYELKKHCFHCHLYILKASNRSCLKRDKLSLTDDHLEIFTKGFPLWLVSLAVIAQGGWQGAGFDLQMPLGWTRWMQWCSDESHGLRCAERRSWRQVGVRPILPCLSTTPVLWNSDIVKPGHLEFTATNFLWHKGMGKFHRENTEILVICILLYELEATLAE